jgi:hypothetical protein
MENNSEELNILLDQAKEFLNAKVEQLSAGEDLSSKLSVKIQSLEKRIEALEEDTKEILELYSSNPNILVNFRKRTSEIKNDIELIKKQ